MYGARIQNYFAARFGLQTVPASMGKGDLRLPDENLFYEFKFSFTATGKREVSIVQIRLHQPIAGYIILTSDGASNFDTHVFLLSKKQMEDECSIMGASSAHGTKAANAGNDTIELRMDLPLKGKDFDRWVSNYSYSGPQLILRSEL